MWFFDRKKKERQFKSGKGDLTESLGMSASFMYQAMCDQYRNWIIDNLDKHVHSKVHNIEFCLQYLQMVNHPVLRLKEMEMETTGEIDEAGRIVPAASNEEELPLIKLKVKFKGSHKTQLLEKLATEMNKFHLNNPRQIDPETDKTPDSK